MIIPRSFWQSTLLFGLLLGCWSSAFAQNRLANTPAAASRSGNRSLGILQQIQEGGFQSLGILALEGALDPHAYQVGPGDQFLVVIGGITPIRLTIPVAADGMLTLPDAPPVLAAGRSLAEVQEEARLAVQSSNQHVAINVSLVQPRQFYVHISGAIPEPGRYLMIPVGRIDDLVQMAFASQARARPDPASDGALRIPGSSTSELPALAEDFHPSLRNVLVKRADGTEISLDLYRYYVEGDMSQNPYLADGDVVHLPPFHQDRDAIRVSGTVPHPGNYEFRPGDTVLDLLALATGGGNLHAYDQVRLVRRVDQETRGEVYDIAALLDDVVTPAPLAAGDHIDVLTQEQATAAIYGFVEYPGTYAIDNANTTLRELMSMAGGLKTEANIRGAYMERRQSLSFKSDSRATDLDFFGQTYLKQSLAENEVAISIESALAPDAPDVLLYSGDVVVFPRDEQTVFVTGNVVRPGYIPFRPGQSAAYYIQLAGGKAPQTTGVYVFEAGTGKVYNRESAVIRPGDSIFINRQPLAETPELQALVIQDEVSKRQTRIATTQTVITGITALVSVVNTFILIRNRVN